MTADSAIHLEVKQHVFRPTPVDFEAFTAVNIDGTQAWLDWCGRHNVQRFLYFSSIKAVRSQESGVRSQEMEDRSQERGGQRPDAGRQTSEDGEQPHSRERERVDPAEALIVDESANGPNNTPYGASKWAAEQRVREWVRSDSRRSALILRPAVIYGPGNAGNVAAMVLALQTGRFFLVGENHNRKSLVAVRNVTAAVAHLLPRMLPGTCEVYNITDRETLTVRELDALIRSCLGRAGNSPTLPEPLARLAAKVGDGLNSVGVGFPLTSNRLEALLETTEFSCAKLIATGFVHPETVEEGIRKMLKC